jgi:hypothetical protein
MFSTAYFDNSLNITAIGVVFVLNASIIQDGHRNTSSNAHKFYSLSVETMNSNIINTLETQQPS